MTHDDLRVLLGGYVVGGLSEPERDALEEHLVECDRCRGELSELEDLPGLLALAGEPAPRPPGQLRQRVLDQAPHSRPARRLLTVVAAAAAILGLGLGVLAAQLLDRQNAATAVALAPVDSEVVGDARLSQTEHGVIVDLRLDGVPALSGTGTYAAWLVSDRGFVSAGTFRPGADGSVRVRLTAAGRFTDYQRFGVTAEPDDADPARNGATIVAGDL